MNHQLAPQGLYTKEECLEQYQTLRANKGGTSSVPSRSPDPQPTPPANGIRNTSIPKASHQDETKGEKVEENWSHEQQKQLENGLLTYPSSCGLSQSDRWKAIAELVEVYLAIMFILYYTCPLRTRLLRTAFEDINRYESQSR